MSPYRHYGVSAFHAAGNISRHEVTVVMTTVAVAIVTLACERSRSQSVLIHDEVLSRLHRLLRQQYSHTPLA